MSQAVYKFYDTSSLLKLSDEKLFSEPFILSSITLQELESIKNSQNHSSEIKHQVRHLVKCLSQKNNYVVHIFQENMLFPINEKNFPINNDMKILATAIDFKNKCEKDLIFVTNDLCLNIIARLFFDEDYISSIQEDSNENYTGYLDLQLSNEELESFYSNMDKNFFNALINQYIILRNENNEIVDRQVWTKDGYRPISFETFNSNHFGKIKPLDIYQQIAADSFTHNKITVIKGPAGSGKTLLSLGFLFQQLEKGKIDKIIIFCNTVAAKNSAKLGYYPGSRSEKLLDSQIGNLLISKLGDRIEVERLMENNKLVLLPMSDIRGYDTSGMNAGIYLSEAQNLDITLMKLALSRIGEDSICIIDGDDKTQVDDIAFEGNNNGMKRASEVFRGTEVYGEIELKQVHRSRIAEIAQRM